MTATKANIDFTNVKEQGDFNTRRQPEGDYKGKILKVEDAPSKKDGIAQWVFTISAGKGTYPYYCKHQENQFWKIRNLLVAAGKNVPKKKISVDPNSLVGKEIGVTLEDDEYEGKPKSVIAAVIPISEVDNDDLDDEDEDASDDDDDSPAAAADDDDDDEPIASIDDEDDDEDDTSGDKFDAMDRTELKQYIAKSKVDVTVRKSMSDDDIRVAIRAAETSSSNDDDDDLEEIDIDDA